MGELSKPYILKTNKRKQNKKRNKTKTNKQLIQMLKHLSQMLPRSLDWKTIIGKTTNNKTNKIGKKNTRKQTQNKNQNQTKNLSAEVPILRALHSFMICYGRVRFLSKCVMRLPWASRKNRDYLYCH